MKLFIGLLSLLTLVQCNEHTKCIGARGTHDSVFLSPSRETTYCAKGGHPITLDFEIDNKRAHRLEIWFQRAHNPDDEWKVEEYPHANGFHSRKLKIEEFENGSYVFTVRTFDHNGDPVCHATSPVIHYKTSHCVRSDDDDDD